MRLTKIAALFAAAGISAPVFATNGMNQAGYGPVSESMGGTSMAYDNGVAGVINNPATLGFMAPGTARVDAGLGDLRPAASVNGMTSDGKDYLMPGLGYARRDGNITWGVGLMAQGGMGTDFKDGSFWGAISTFGMGSDTSGTTKRNMSEVGVGRVMFPLVFNVNPDLTIGGTIDYVWAGMDVKWLIDGAHFSDMISGSNAMAALAGGFGYTPTHTFGTASGTFIDGFVGSLGMGAGQISGVSWGYFDFEKDGHFSQAAKGTGWAGNIGFTYKATPQLTIGGVYHAKTSLSDMKTSDTGATLTMNVAVNGVGNVAVPVVGKVTVKNFQWPETYGLGIAYKATDQWLLTADYKQINWSGVLKNFVMQFDAAPAAAQTGPMAPGFGNASLLVTYFQNWKDQNVFEFGAAYRYNEALTLRFGVNAANNPIPDQYVSPLFPAVMKTHYMGGFGYAFDKASSLDFAGVYAPKVKVTNDWSKVGGSNQDISLGTDFSFQIMYAYRY